MTLADTVLDLCAASLAGGAGCVIGHPLDVIKVRLQTLSGGQASASSLVCAAGMWRNEGFRSFWRGLQAPLWGVAAYQAVLFSSFNLTLNFLGRLSPPPAQGIYGAQ